MNPYTLDLSCLMLFALYCLRLICLQQLPLSSCQVHRHKPFVAMHIPSGLLVESSNRFLKQLDTRNVSVVGAALCDAFESGKPTDGCDSPTETVFSYSV